MKTAKILSVGLAIMGLVHCGATYSPMIAGKLATLNEGAQGAFIYMSLMCGALLVMGGVVSYMLADKLKEHAFLRCPYMIIVAMMALDGVLAALYMMHNPCAWIVLALALPLLVISIIRK